MFDFLKQKKLPLRPVDLSVSKDEIDFLKRVFLFLPQKYDYLTLQLDSNIIDHKIVNRIDPSFYTLALNSNANRFSNILKPYILLKGIRIKRKATDIIAELQVGVSEGVFSLYSLRGADYKDLDTNTTDISELEEFCPANQPVDEFIKLVGIEIFNKLSSKFVINNIYKTSWDDGEYIVFSVDEDGNVYCVDKQCNFYFCTHTPPSQKRISF